MNETTPARGAITEEMVEAGAQALLRMRYGDAASDRWLLLEANTRDRHLQNAREVFDALAPLLRAQYEARVAEMEEALSDADAEIQKLLRDQEALQTTESDARRMRDAPLQARVDPWLMACFGEKIARDRIERNHRFLEEALELVQACGCTQSEAHQLVDYVYGRPVGEPSQECGGVMITLAALCLAHGLDMHRCGETELASIWTMVDKIRAKQVAKPKHSPLPGPPEPNAESAPERDAPTDTDRAEGIEESDPDAHDGEVDQ